MINHMDEAVNYHLRKDIVNRTKLTGGYTFETWLLTLSGGQRVVFRSQRDFMTGGGRAIVIADVLEREKFFYDTVNRENGRICPEVYAVDGSRELFENSYCLMEYMEGTPLNLCFDGLGARAKNGVLYKIGEICARINGIEIDRNHHYLAGRDSWEAHIAGRLRERLAPLVQNGVVTTGEIERIAGGLRGKKAAKTLSFLHLDMRRINMILNGREIYILDAENCDFGDPLCELATLDAAGELCPVLIEGYRSVCGDAVDLDSPIYHYYVLERLALVLDLFMNEVKDDISLTRHYLNMFLETKNRLV